MRVFGLLLALAACGRIYFDPLAGDAGHGDGDGTIGAKNFLLATSPDSLLAIFARDPSGALIELPSSPAAIPVVPDRIAVTPDGIVALLTRMPAPRLDLLQIDYATGAITASNFATVTASYDLMFHPTLRIVYLAHYSGTSIETLAYDPTTLAFASLGSSARPGYPNTRMRMHPSRPVLFVLDGSSPELYSFDIDNAGVATYSGHPGWPIVDSYAEALAIDATGTYGWVTPENTGGVAGFTIAPDNTISTTPGSAFGTGVGVAYGIAISPNNKFLFIAAEQDCHTFVFTIGPVGVIDPIAQPAIRDNRACTHAVVAPDNDNIYMTGYDAPIIHYHVDAATGALSPDPGELIVSRGTSRLDQMATLDLL